MNQQLHLPRPFRCDNHKNDYQSNSDKHLNRKQIHLTPRPPSLRGQGEF